MSTRSVMIMAGGTGGHVFPALAVAHALRDQEIDVVWLGTRQGLEARVVPGAGFPMEWISVSGLRGKGFMSWVLAPLRLLIALLQSLRVIARRKPGAVLGMGGFVSGPGGIAAWLSRRPLVIHEQNAVAGVTNRVLARFATRILEGFPGSFGERAQAETIGNPVRREIIAVAPPQQRFADRTGPPRLLVIGGSQGALALNTWIGPALSKWKWQQAPVVRHQAGVKTLDTARAAYADAGFEFTIEPFIEDMAEAYAWADLVVCRAGAITVAELAAVGVAAVLIPFPSAVDDHQTRNAEFLVNAGAAELLRQSEMSEERLGACIGRLLADRTVLLRMAERARVLAKPSAGDSLTEACAALASGDSK
ncbi:MAG: undecaprenyldiphospho-muramoylpentapeptide beta-N-acetylglucosaminyltransferase [Gammaproteobacteria bacterium]|nr:undecaprenyldiphospho-muramoylpentapeptide beta-N-acetylglucosaminyltransferase [Gammaproteobacteria bacterium]